MTALLRLLPIVTLFLSFIAIGCGEQAEPAPMDKPVEADTASTAEPVREVDLSVEAPLLRIGFVKQDHHSAVFVAALRSDEMSRMYPVYLVPLGEQFYALVEDGIKVAEIEFVQSQGAINVPNNMAAGLFDIGFGGVVPFASSADKGSGVRIIAPMHSRGDMLVVASGNESVTDWDSFLAWVDTAEEPVTIGFKSPTAVALIIFQSALSEVGIPYSMQSDPAVGSKILLFNAQGQPNLNPALQNGTIDAYISNNPACALAESNGIGRCIAELSDLPPGDFNDHPCCAVAGLESAIADKPEVIAAALRLFEASTDYINTHPEDAAAAAAEWIGIPVDVELISMATSGYDMHVTEEWLANMDAIIAHMRDLNVLTGPLAEGDAGSLYDFSLMPEGLR